MATYTLVATATFGLEAIVADELRALGYGDLTVENGRVSFAGEAEDVARCNLWLRTADRLLIEMARFKATDFEELFQGTREIRWEDLISENGKMHVLGKSVKSRLFSVPDCQAIVKKAVVEAMRKRYHGAWFEETGAVYRIEVALASDTATITVDTSGAALHKRGYRIGQGEAPLKETLAAAMVRLSRWEPGRGLWYPGETVDGRADAGRQRADYRVLVLDPDGKPVGLTPFGREDMAAVEPEYGNRLKQFEGIGAIIPLAKWFQLKRPGEYTVLATLKAPDETRAAVDIHHQRTPAGAAALGPLWVAKPIKVRVPIASK